MHLQFFGEHFGQFTGGGISPVYDWSDGCTCLVYFYNAPDAGGWGIQINVLPFFIFMCNDLTFIQDISDFLLEVFSGVINGD